MTNTLLRLTAIGAMTLGLVLNMAAVAHADGPDHKRTGNAVKESRHDSDHDKDNDRGKGKGSHQDKSDGHASAGGSTQGKAKSDPDGMTNAYGGSTGLDKPGYDGGKDKRDQDGNNGCGNDADREDDNRGNCGGKGHAAVASGNNDHKDKADDDHKVRADDDDKDKVRNDHKDKDDDDDGKGCANAASDDDDGYGRCADKDRGAAVNAGQNVVICQCLAGDGKSWVVVIVDAHKAKEHLARGDKFAVNGPDCPPAANTASPGPAEAAGGVSASVSQPGGNGAMAAGNADMNIVTSVAGVSESPAVAGQQEAVNTIEANMQQPANEVANTPDGSLQQPANVIEQPATNGNEAPDAATAVDSANVAAAAMQQAGPESTLLPEADTLVASDSQTAEQTAVLPQFLPSAGDPLTYVLAGLGIFGGIFLITAGIATFQGRGRFTGVGR